MKMFKKLMAVALVAVMALSLFTACGVSKSDIKDAIKTKTSMTYDSALEKDSAYKKVKETFDDFHSYTSKSTIREDLDKAIKDNTATDGTVIIYAVDGDEDDLAADIKTQVNNLATKNSCTYSTFACDIHNGTTDSTNAVLVIIKKAN